MAFYSSTSGGLRQQIKQPCAITGFLFIGAVGWKPDGGYYLRTDFLDR